jgi:rod shape-determining protein MreD
MGLTPGIPLLILAAVLQASVLSLLFPLGGGPDLVLLLVVAWAFNAELRSSVLWAFIGGLLLDLLSAAPLGTSSLGLVIIAVPIAGVGGRVYRLGPLWIFGITLAASLFFEAYRVLIVDLMQLVGVIPSDTGFTPSWTVDFAAVVLPTMLYNLALIWVVYFFARRIQKRVLSPEPR